MHVDATVVLRSVVTVVWFLTFAGLWAWAWSERRRDDFAAASQLPFDEQAPSEGGQHEGKP
jgi:cytochrome c oxidase cbb3-type subunit IV